MTRNRNRLKPIPKIIVISAESHRFANCDNEDDIRWKDVCCVAVHPGNMISTNLSRHWWIYRLLFGIVRPFVKSVQQAAGTVVFAAAASELDRTSGLYINNCFLCKPADIVESLDARKALWENSVQLLMNRLDKIE